MCFFPFFSPLRQPRCPLVLFACKTLLFGGEGFRLFPGFNPLPQLLMGDLQELPTLFVPACFALRVFFLYLRTGLI